MSPDERTLRAEEAADRLAAIVRWYIAQCDEYAAQIKDPNPPSMTAFREDIRFYDESVKLRNQ